MSLGIQDLKNKYKEEGFITFGLTIKQMLKGNIWKKILCYQRDGLVLNLTMI